MTRDEAKEVFRMRMDKFKNTQSIQWKMNLSIWTLLVLGIYSSQLLQVQKYAIVPILLFIIGVHIVYCHLTQKSLDSDKRVMDDIAFKLNNANKIDDQIQVDINLEGSTSSWSSAWIWLQIALTIALALTLFLIKFYPATLT